MRALSRLDAASPAADFFYLHHNSVKTLFTKDFTRRTKRLVVQEESRSIPHTQKRKCAQSTRPLEQVYRTNTVT